MSKLDFKTSDSLAFCWESTEMQWFILIASSAFPCNTTMNLHLKKSIFRIPNLGRNEENKWKFQSMSKTEEKSQVLEKHHTFGSLLILLLRIRGGKKYQGKSLNIKVDDGLSKTVDENLNVETYVNLDWRINAALESFKIKYSGSQDKTVIVFVSIRLESVLRHIAGLSLVP
ncbi:hypothetical protein T4B_3205 [Trichinella pseudospiralis]|uniref:Uncharacterized protein n=1 Tax=Trichinella pseudospiralis TaxID=6337 RepID=A0A0V1DVS3_TRIPS|nr:hypothetical protein T4A_8035 [Trichinella pseudospiralis]KRZ05330.1 hypothetical protein T4B_3205 [Trichinella pseudospiralis]KRZ35359.1 hypothetical protein T4C_5126 [Trichinella pseudospiralis]